MREKRSLTREQIGYLIAKHRKTILRSSDFDLNDYGEYLKHSNLIKAFGDNYMAREFSSFIADEYNSDVIRFLIYYFNDCKIAEEIFPDMEYKLHKNLLLIGHPGTGKSIIMQMFSDYLRLTFNPNSFRNTSVTEMMNYYKIYGHIDRFTYNECARISGHTPYPSENPYPEKTFLCKNGSPDLADWTQAASALKTSQAENCIFPSGNLSRSEEKQENSAENTGESPASNTGDKQTTPPPVFARINPSSEGAPTHICLNDIGLETEKQRSYGTPLHKIIDEFLYARYEIYQLYGCKFHLTSNLNITDFKHRFDSQLVDRFKSFNVVPLLGTSRRT